MCVNLFEFIHQILHAVLCKSECDAVVIYWGYDRIFHRQGLNIAGGEKCSVQVQGLVVKLRLGPGQVLSRSGSVYSSN